MTKVRSTFLEAARAAVALIGHPAVAAAWDRPSALDDMSVGALAAHLARAGVLVRTYLDATAEASAGPGGTPAATADAPGYYLAFAEQLTAGTAFSGGVVDRARQGAEAGAPAVAESITAAVADLERTLPGLPDDQVIIVKDGIVLTLDDYLRTRIIELAVHADDLVASLPSLGGLPAGLDAAQQVAIETLTELAVRRHGRAAVLRALTRRERDAVQALRVL